MQIKIWTISYHVHFGPNVNIFVDMKVLMRVQFDLDPDIIREFIFWRISISWYALDFYPVCLTELRASTTYISEKSLYKFLSSINVFSRSILQAYFIPLENYEKK